jgi:uncharacterized protein
VKQRPKKFLILFAKEPRPGRVKTRLLPQLSPQQGAALSTAFLEDSVNRYGRIRGARHILAVEPAQAIPRLRRKIRGLSSWELQGQGNGDLGRRLLRMARWSFKEGSQQTCFLGSDSPTLPLPYVREAFRLLKSTPVVIGPSIDGGYYLIGISQWVPEVFQRIPWGTHHVFDATLKSLERHKIGVKVLLPWYDVDTPGSFLFLGEHMNTLKQKRGVDFPIKTHQAIGKLNRTIKLNHTL